jgi:hypothetical protein
MYASTTQVLLYLIPSTLALTILQYKTNDGISTC